jgi:hypothetical protein
MLMGGFFMSFAGMGCFALALDRHVPIFLKNSVFLLRMVATVFLAIAVCMTVLALGPVMGSLYGICQFSLAGWAVGMAVAFVPTKMPPLIAGCAATGVLSFGMVVFVM